MYGPGKIDLTMLTSGMTLHPRTFQAGSTVQDILTSQYQHAVYLW